MGIEKMHETTKELIKRGFFIERDGYILKAKSWSDEKKYDVLAKMNCTDKGVIVVGQPKTGNHAILAMLDGFGIERAEELNIDGGISTMPFEDQPNLMCYKRMEEKMKTSKNYITLPHAHIKAPYFPKKFNGKIIHVTRDPRAVAVSGYHFFGSLASKLDYYKAYFEFWDFKNADDFARHSINGDFYAGDVKEYFRNMMMNGRKLQLSVVTIYFISITRT